MSSNPCITCGKHVNRDLFRNYCDDVCLVVRIEEMRRELKE